MFYINISCVFCTWVLVSNTSLTILQEIDDGGEYTVAAELLLCVLSDQYPQPNSALDMTLIFW